MKVILTIFCALMLLFSGGCAVILLFDANAGQGASVALALIPGAIAFLNALILLALSGKSGTRPWAFYLLAGIDVVAAIVIAVMWASMASQMADIAVVALPLIGLLLLKAVLTVLMVRKTGGQQP